MITIAYSHRDSLQAERLIHWIGFLSAQNGDDVRKDGITLIPSLVADRTTRSRRIVNTAANLFGKVEVVSPNGQDERGWPSSPNFMFRTALLNAEAKGGRDILWIEPDAVPITPGWYRDLKAELAVAKKAGKHFVGSFVHHNVNHMSGNGWYCSTWRKVAPMLGEADKTAWDVYAASQVMPHAYFTKLIQHIFRTPKVRDTKLLAPAAVLFHQDKVHNLMRILDRERYGGKFFCGRPDVVEHEHMSTKYYLTQNATKPVQTMGYTFTFAACQHICGKWRGILQSESEEEQIVLATLTDDPRSGITEISQEEYEARLKKKPNSVRVSPVLAKFKRPTFAVERQVAVVRSAAKEVEPAPVKPPGTGPTSVTVEEVITTGPIEPTEQPQKVPRRKTRTRKVKADVVE